MQSVLFVFVDGIGLGDPDPAVNPLANGWQGLARLSGGARWQRGAPPVARPGLLFRSIDANLGVDGLPQSGTGQATLLTGVNCAQLAGRHYGPFPHSTSRDALRDRSVFRRLRSSAFANAFPPKFFEVVSRRDRWPVTTRACLDANVRIRTLDDLAGGRGLAADVTGEGLARFGAGVSPVSPEQAADRLAAMASAHAFTLFEIFLTDKAGHAQDRRQADEILSRLDRMVHRLVDVLPPSVTLLLTSDHGNMEDLSVRTHTRNPVPLAVRGPGAGHFDSVHDLTGVAPAILAAAGAD